MDEPCSALDPMQQAMRVSDYTGFMYLGELVEFDKTENVFRSPGKDLTKRYVEGTFG